LNSVNDWLCYDVVRFKIEVAVEEKFMCKNVTRNIATATAAARLGAIFDDLDLSTQRRQHTRAVLAE